MAKSAYVIYEWSPRSQDEPESRNSNPQPSVVGTLLDNDLRFFKAFSLHISIELISM